MTQPERDRYFVLIQDESCHWYVIPSDKQDEWSEWQESEAASLGEIPDWATDIGGAPSLVEFSHFRIR